MAKEKSGKDSITPPDNAIPDKKVFWTSKKLETVVAILLGIATLLSAWSSWIGSLHSGIQSINFTKSNNTSSEGTAAYNSSLQMYIADYMVWNTLCDYTSDLELAKAEGNEVKVKHLEEQINTFAEQSVSPTLGEGIKWMKENNMTNPFEMPGISEKYFGEAQKKLADQREILWRSTKKARRRARAAQGRTARQYQGRLLQPCKRHLFAGALPARHHQRL